MPITTQSNGSDTNRPQMVILTLALAAMLGMLNGFSLSAFMPAVARDLDVSVPLLGQVMTATFVGATLVSVFAGPMADLYGKRRLISIGLTALTLSAIGTAFAPTFGWLLATRMISAVSAGVLAGTTLAMAGSLFDGDERRHAMAWIASGIAAGGVIGLPLLTVIAELTSWRTSFGVIGVLGLLWIILIQRLLPNDARPGGRIQPAKILAAYRPLLGDRMMLSFYGSTVTRSIGWTGTLTYLGAYLGDELHLSTSEIGLAYMVGGGGYFIGTKLAGTRFGSSDLRAIYGTATMAMGIFLALSVSLPIGPIPAIGLLMVAGITGGFGWVALVSLVSISSPTGQGTTMSLNAAMFQVGSALGGLFGGLLLAIGGYATLGLGLMGFAFLAVSLVWRPAPLALRSRNPRTAAAE